MLVCTPARCSSPCLLFNLQRSNGETSSLLPSIPQLRLSNHVPKLPTTTTATRASISENSPVVNAEKTRVTEQSSPELPEPTDLSRVETVWQEAKDFKESGQIYEGRVESFNVGGVLIRVRSILGFIPYRELSPSNAFKEPQQNVRDIGKRLLGTTISAKVIEVNEQKGRLILSEKQLAWTLYSEGVSIGDIFEARVASVLDYAAFVHLRFPDGFYHLSGILHAFEVSWDFVSDVRHVLKVGDAIRVKVIHVWRNKRRIELSLKQLKEDPFHETLDKVVTSLETLSQSSGTRIEPLPGLEAILAELLKEDGIEDAKIIRQGFERRVVSQDLQLWLSNAPPQDKVFSLLARAGRQVQEICLTTSLDQGGIKIALQRALERVP